MRVLLINELYKMGGAEMQTLREIDLLRSRGHDVYRISCDKSLCNGWQQNDKKHYNIIPRDNSQMNWHLKRILRFFIRKDLRLEIMEIIQSVKPDIVHISNMTYEPLTFYNVLEEFKTVQTIRDFGAVCPRELCVDLEYRACGGYCFGNCMKQCAFDRSILQKIYFMMDKIYLKRVNIARKKGIVKFICPSRYLSDICSNNNIPTMALNNSFDFSIIKEYKKSYSSHKKYLYYGFVAKHKGIIQLIEAFKIFSKGKDVELEIIGKIDTSFKKEFEQSLSGFNGIHYLGHMTYAEIIKHLQSVYTVVVPSLWLENYPNTALEGLATKCVVLGSNRGGIPELIRDNRFTFDILDIESIIQSLEYSYNLTEKEWEKITEDNYQFTRKNNSLDIYYTRIMKVFDDIISDS